MYWEEVIDDCSTPSSENNVLVTVLSPESLFEELFLPQTCPTSSPANVRVTELSMESLLERLSLPEISGRISSKSVLIVKVLPVVLSPIGESYPFSSVASKSFMI